MKRRFAVALGLAWMVFASPIPAVPLVQNSDSVYVAVADNRGRPVTGLTAADFEVLIDDRRQEILSVKPATDPASIVLLTDRLGLEDGFSYIDLQRALASFVKGIRAALPDSQFSLTTFDGPVVRVLPLTAAPAELDRQIGRLTTVARDAALLDALTDACKTLNTAATKRRLIFLVYAGYRPDTSTATPELVGAMLQASGASVWAIEARTTGENTFGHANRELVVDRGTGITGGRRDIVASAVGVDTMARQMAALIASQQLITYGPGTGDRNSERKVKVARPNVRVYASAWLTR